MRRLRPIAEVGLTLTLLAAAAKPSPLPERKTKTAAAALKEEHTALQTGLREALVSGGRTEAAARELAEALDAHIKRDDQVLLPLLVLEDKGPSAISPKRRADAAELSDTLSKDEAKMADEQLRFSAILYKLRDAAREEHKPRFEQLAEIVQLHMEKEARVYLPKAEKVAQRFRVDSPLAH